MNDQEFKRRVEADVARIMKQTMWGDDTIPPSAFEFEARPIDVEMWLNANSCEPHPSTIHAELVCRCGSWVAHMMPYVDFQTGESIPESIHCTNAFDMCPRVPMEQAKRMGPSEATKYFKTRETLHGDDVFTWPHIIRDVEDKDGRYLAELPMTREELVRARVTRFHNARRSFRKDFP